MLYRVVCDKITDMLFRCFKSQLSKKSFHKTDYKKIPAFCIGKLLMLVLKNIKIMDLKC